MRRIKTNTRNFNDPKYITWRNEVYNRDKHNCQWPGCIRRRGLNAHHIRRWANFPTLRFLVNNGITLCKIHHKFIKGREDDYIILFNQILQMKAKHV